MVLLLMSVTKISAILKEFEETPKFYLIIIEM